jgi:hypothetical protein
VLPTPGTRPTEKDGSLWTPIFYANPPVESSTNTRAERALKLFEERGHLIRAVAADTFEVPSCGMASKRYIVRYGGEVESCSCKDFEFGYGRACKHLLAVGIMHAARRSGVVVKQSFAMAAGDGFAYAAKRRRGCSRCYGGYVYIGVEEDGTEHDEVVPCRRCNAENL